MALTTPFTTLLGCRHPLQQAGMGGASTPALAAAVANAGGLGMLAGAREETLAEVEAATDRPWGVNFLVPFLDLASFELAARRARLVELFWGWPDAALVRRGHAGGALVGWQVGTVDEATAAVEAGCDVVVAQGTEAGGHVRAATGLLPLLDGVLDAIDGHATVVAAGGIGSGRAMAAALAAGADAVRVGTRFVATVESGAHPDYKQALVGAGPADTVLTEAFSVFWPDAPHRVLRSCVDAATALPPGDEVVGEMAFGDQRVPVPRFGVMPPEASTTGAIGAMALYAGESVGAVRAVLPAAAVVEELVSSAEALLTPNRRLAHTR
jgi:nitronate monooxygenase